MCVGVRCGRGSRRSAGRPRGRVARQTSSSSPHGLPADRPARAVLYHRGVLVDADAAAAWGPEGDPVLDPGRWKTRQEIEVRNDEVAGQDTQAVAQPDTTRHPVLVEVVGRVALLPA